MKYTVHEEALPEGLWQVSIWKEGEAEAVGSCVARTLEKARCGAIADLSIADFVEFEAEQGDDAPIEIPNWLGWLMGGALGILVLLLVAWRFIT